MWRTPAGRGFIMLAAASAAFGFAMNAFNNLVTNYFNDVLLLSGPQFGYMTAVREVGGFVLIFLTAMFYRVSVQKLAAGALVVIAIAFAFFDTAGGFWTVIPWALLTSFGGHTVLQSQVFLGMSLTSVDKSGSILGRVNGITAAGTVTALVMIFVTFRFEWLSYRATFYIMAVVAIAGALAIFRFPHLHEGQPRTFVPRRRPIVWSRFYHYYYWLSLLDGARGQVFFTFGLWVLVNRFKLDVARVSILLLIVTFLCIFTTPRLGRAIDRFGERRALAAVNVACFVALLGYALSSNVIVVCLFYVLYTIIAPLPQMAASTYLRKICAPEHLVPSLAMGVTMSHAMAVVFPIVAGFVLNFVGYQVPFYFACGVAVIGFFVSLRVDASGQRCPARIAADEESLARKSATDEVAADYARA
jgi:hypothetical protein